MRTLGYCPQYDPLFPHLSVEEHRRFYARLKGAAASSFTSDAALLRRLGLWEKRHTRASTLSGGQQRKLSLLIALSGDPKLLLLDEPSTGLDPAVRKEVDSVLRLEATKRLVLLTSHYLEEAERISDKVVVMHEGQVLEQGSPVELKRCFGEQVHVSLTLGSAKAEVRDEVRRLLKAKCADATVGHLEGRKLTLLFPAALTSWSDFYEALEELEKARDVLGIQQISARITLLEDAVKMKVAAFEKAHEAAGGAKDHQLADPHADLASPAAYQFAAQRRDDSFTAKLRASFWKQMVMRRRRMSMLVAQCVIPLAAVAIGGLLVAINSHRSQQLPPLVLSDMPPYAESQVIFPANGTESGIVAQIRETMSDDGLIASSMPGDVEENILNTAIKQGIPYFYSRHFLAFDNGGDNDSVKLYFSNTAPHVISTGVNIVRNAMLRIISGPEYSIQTINDPLPSDRITVNSYGEEFIIAICTSIGLLLFLSLFAVGPTQERQSGAKALQRLSGLSPLAFWLPNFVLDLLLSLLVNVAVVGILAGLHIDLLIKEMGWRNNWLLLTAHAWGVLPLVYLGSLTFSAPVSAVSKLAVLNIALSICPIITSESLRTMSFQAGSEYLDNYASLVHSWSSRALPQFAMAGGLMKYYTNQFLLQQCHLTNISCKDLGPTWPTVTNPLELAEPGIGGALVGMLCQGVAFSLLLCLVEGRWLQRLYDALASRTDEEEEESLFERRGRGCPALELKAVSVQHPGMDRRAVDQVSAKIAQGSAVCLLGHNGAGKSSLFRVLTNQLQPSCGWVKLLGRRLGPGSGSLSDRLGFCPQSDAVLAKLTGEENLRYFARLRGIVGEEQDSVVQSLIVALGLEEQVMKAVGSMSGGNRRKVSLGVGVMGAPPLLLLDEPTAGVDPAGRTRVAALLERLRSVEGSALLVSSHSADLVEAVARELLVLRQGKAVFTGPVQEFAQSKQGYRLTLVLGSEEAAGRVGDRLAEEWEGATLTDQPDPRELHAHIPHAHGRGLVDVLKMVHWVKSHERLTHFALSESGLETAIAATGHVFQ